ncbi:MAG: universal stress protein [Salinivirgaceae bacterium]|nr:universal stress protein [Salinivirgaceae bacterium]
MWRIILQPVAMVFSEIRHKLRAKRTAMDKYILVPVDFSPSSINAMEHAVLYANAMKCDIKMIHVKRRNADYDPVINYSDYDEVLKSSAANNFKRIIAHFSGKMKGKMDYCVRDGRVFTEVCNQAKYGDALMIISGTNGVSGFKERWEGSNAFRIVSHASCPVITIKYNFVPQNPRRIVVPIDNSDRTRLKIPFVASIAKSFNAEMILVDVRNDNKLSTQKKMADAMKAVTVYLDRHNVRYSKETLQVKKSKNARAVIDCAIENDADLIAATSERLDSGWQQFSVSNQQRLVNHSPIPVITIKVA